MNKISSLKYDQKTEMKEMIFPNEINETQVIKVATESLSQMPTSHHNENITTPEMKHSPITDWNCLTWLCYLCEESFNGFENLSTHQELFHKDRNKEEDHFICFDCKETLSEYSIFLNHIRSRHYNSLKLCCDVCNKVLPDYAHLAEHRDEHIEYTNEIHPSVYHCNLCEEVAATEKILKLHTNENHDLKSSDATKENYLSDLFEAEEIKWECPDDIEDESVVEDCVKCEEEYNDTEELFQCGRCVQNFKTEASLERHMETHNSERPFKCDVCSKKFTTKRILKQHMETHNSERSFKCDVCCKTFTTKAYLKQHMETHNSERPFNCDICCKTFTTKFYLKHHMITHNSDRPFKCDVCSHKLTTKAYLKQHMETHNSERSFKCDVCSKKFTTKRYLKQHMETHNSERPFKCDVCSKTFKTKDSLRHHMATHNSERSFKCDVCSKKFTTKRLLRQHMITHNTERPFKCGVCCKKFTTKRVLKQHMITHNTERLFKCGVCSKTYTSKECLKQHMITHNTERPFKCDVCSHKFTRKSHLKSHMITHNNSERSAGNSNHRLAIGNATNCNSVGNVNIGASETHRTAIKRSRRRNENSIGNGSGGVSGNIELCGNESNSANEACTSNIERKNSNASNLQIKNLSQNQSNAGTAAGSGGGGGGTAASVGVGGNNVNNNTSGSGGSTAGKKKKRRARESGAGQLSSSAATRDVTPPPEPIDRDEPTYCVCNQISFGEMILCDNNLCPIEWFHFSCVSLVLKPKGKWFCPNCRDDRPNVVKLKSQFLKELERYNKEKEEKT